MTLIGIWIIIFIIGLFVLEMIGVARGDNRIDTITEVFRWVRGRKDAPGWRVALGMIWMFLVVGLMIWCIVHFVFDWV